MNKVFFDLDGTLLNSQKRHIIALEWVLKEYLKSDENILNGYMVSKCAGKSTLTYLMEICGLDANLAKSISRRWIEIIETPELLEYDVLFEDSIETLKNVNAKYMTVLLTARKSEHNLLTQLENLNVIKLFDNIICVSPQQAIEEKKEILEINSKNIELFIGDTEIDWKAASELGIPFYPLNRGFRNKHYWEEIKIKSYEDLANVYKFLRMD